MFGERARRGKRRGAMRQERGQWGKRRREEERGQ